MDSQPWQVLVYNYNNSHIKEIQWEGHFTCFFCSAFEDLFWKVNGGHYLLWRPSCDFLNLRSVLGKVWWIIPPAVFWRCWIKFGQKWTARTQTYTLNYCKKSTSWIWSIQTPLRMQSTQNEGLGDFWDSCSYFHVSTVLLLVTRFLRIPDVFFFGGVYLHDRREESTLAALSGIPVMLWAQTAQADNFDPGKLKRERREWWRCKMYCISFFERVTQSRVT